MTNTAKSAAPPWAVTAWVDDRFAYVEIPGVANSPPYVMKHPLTEGGLGKALSMMRGVHQELRHVGSYKLPAAPIKRIPAKAEKFSSKQRAAARAILKKTGLI